ncbi:MAG: amino acid-binding protein [Bacteroidales bacterium]|nr:amino acid-binding protein [Bacteroidales bacterium]
MPTIIKQLSIFLENKTGRLTEVTRLLGKSGINLTAFSMSESSDFGIMRVVLSDPETAQNLLISHGFTVTLSDVVCLFVPNTPGTLSEALLILSEHNVSVEYMYAFAMDDMARVIIRPSNIDRCVEVLQKSNLKLAKASDIYYF